MKNFSPPCFLIFVLIIVCSQTTQAQELEKAPDYSPVNHSIDYQNTTENSVVALWDLVFDYPTADEDPGNVSNGIHFNSEFWVAEWNSDTLIRLDNDGNLLEIFTIPTLTGTRAMTWDGTNLWIANNSETIYEVDPISKNIISTQNLAFSGGIRFLTFDETADGGNGGFWVGNFNTDITLFSMDGTELITISADTHTLGGMYGAAVDNISDGGPYLWVFHQPGSPSDAIITQLKLPEGMPTGIGRDVEIDLNIEGSLAGGLFITTDWDSDGNPVLGGVTQGSPDRIFGYDLSFEVSPIVNIGAVSIPSPISACGLTDTEPIIVSIENNGAVPVSDILLEFYRDDILVVSELFDGSVPAGETVDYTFDATMDMSAFGTYDFSVVATTAGDVNNSNDKTTKFVANKAFASPPVNVNFDDLPLEETVFVDLYNVGEIPFWVNSGETGSNNTGPISDLLGGTGQYVYMETSGRDRGEQAILTTNCLDLTNIINTELAFGYHAYGDGIEYLSVDVTDEAGVVTNLLFFEGQQQTSNDDAWGLEFVDLTQFDGQIIEISFKGEIGPDGDIFNCDIALDEITISGVVSANEIESLDRFSVSPNPVSDKLSVMIELNTHNEKELYLFNSLGQEILFAKGEALQNENFELNVSDVASGVYILQLVVDNEIATRKVIINH